MKLQNDLKLQFEKGLCALSPELAVMDAILNQHPEIYEMVKNDITMGQKSSNLGRQDMPTVEQIVRAAIYKERPRRCSTFAFNGEFARGVPGLHLRLNAFQKVATVRYAERNMLAGTVQRTPTCPQKQRD